MSLTNKATSLAVLLLGASFCTSGPLDIRNRSLPTNVLPSSSSRRHILRLTDRSSPLFPLPSAVSSAGEGVHGIPPISSRHLEDAREEGKGQKSIASKREGDDVASRTSFTSSSSSSKAPLPSASPFSSLSSSPKHSAPSSASFSYSSSPSSFSFTKKKRKRNAFELDKECSKEQMTNTSQIQKDYIHNYLTHNLSGNIEKITIGFLSSFKYNKLALGALPIAVEDVNKDKNLLPDRTLDFEVADVGNSNMESLAALSIRRMTTMRDRGHLAFIGPDDNCANEALVAAAWNLPMITYKCADKKVSNKAKYYTFARTLPPSTKIVKALVALLKHYQWRQFVLLTENTRSYLQIREAVKSFADHHGLNVTREESVPYDYTTKRYPSIQRFVRASLRYTRIYVLLASYEVQWDFVLALQEEARDALPEYAIVTIDDDKYNPANQGQDVRVPGKDNEMMNLKEDTANRIYNGFRAVVKITPAFPADANYKEFEKKVLNRIKQHPFCVPYNEEIFRYIEVPISAAHLYDAVMIYAQVLTETLADPTANPANGTHILTLIKNRSFPSIQGFKVHMDENGDAEGSYSLLAIRKRPSSQSMAMAWHKVGQFLFHDKTKNNNNYTNNMDNLPELKLHDIILWLGDSHPRDAPPCGFDFEKCDGDWRSFAIGLVVALVFLVVALFLFRHYRYEHKLACLLWKIDMRDVKIMNSQVPTLGFGNNNMVHAYRQSVFTCVEGGQEIPRMTYCRTGVYKGNVVAIKLINKRSLDLTRSIRKELKQMREVRHENLLPFIGASVESGAVCILVPYCSRGSLEDVLMSEDNLLDNMFVASLIADLIKGMTYLHDSEIVSHGNLRSSNCLIDSRWVLQVADFGLHEFKMTTEHTQDARKKLWMAPELLRAPTGHPRGTQKGDVFSFGVILYEVKGRIGPWGSILHKYTIQEVVAEVSRGSNPPLRPPLDSLDAPPYVHRCLKECWSEDPDDRPDFKLIRIRLKEMQAGLKLNIVDNMLVMMEKYAYNLEGKVQERTHQLMEEKKKTENLLLRMLPKSVAESLKRGEQVAPESYDNVTIYFSDIVGFTSLSADSSPLQMVNMLNELYTCFDAIIGDYDVYKVETIGDAYMVVSGLPIANGNRHASEVASMALKLLAAVKKFTIRHRPGDTLKLRIGIHSGPCVAGVVGLTMPRYCLFGDTVNTAARMESTGEPLRIHVSDANKRMLDKLGGYVVQERGLTYVKGKGQLRTWWLVGEQQNLLPEGVAVSSPRTSPSPLTFPSTPTATTHVPTGLSPIATHNPTLSPTPASCHSPHNHPTTPTITTACHSVSPTVNPTSPIPATFPNLPPKRGCRSSPTSPQIQPQSPTVFTHHPAVSIPHHPSSTPNTPGSPHSPHTSTWRGGSRGYQPLPQHSPSIQNNTQRKNPFRQESSDGKIQNSSRSSNSSIHSKVSSSNSANNSNTKNSGSKSSNNNSINGNNKTSTRRRSSSSSSNSSNNSKIVKNNRSGNSSSKSPAAYSEKINQTFFDYIDKGSGSTCSLPNTRSLEDASSNSQERNRKTERSLTKDRDGDASECNRDPKRGRTTQDIDRNLTQPYKLGNSLLCLMPQQDNSV